MDEFCKIYETPDTQILVKLDSGDDGEPEVRLYFRPRPELGVCSQAFSFDDSDEGWDKAEQAYAMIDYAKATGILAEVRAIWEEAQE